MTEIRRIDAHHHISPKRYVEILDENGITEFPGGNTARFPEWDEAILETFMEKYSIRAVVASLASPGIYFSNASDPRGLANLISRYHNEYSAELADKMPKRFGSFASMPLPFIDDAIKEAEYALDVLKLDGIALYTNYDGAYLGDEKYDQFFACLNERKAVVCLHPDMYAGGLYNPSVGFPPNLLDAPFDTTRTVFNLVMGPWRMTLKYPDVKFILPHAGGATPFMVARAMHPMLFVPIYEDLAEIGLESQFAKFYYDIALTSSPHTFASLQTLVDTTHILFGTDFVTAQPVEIEYIIKGLHSYSGFTEDDVEKIECDNMLALFPRFR